ncbi:MAG: hypothetical protein HYS15_02370 [Candidatus Spechtbacteria bacterium]|nr:hypothetical protein [Candidatus Spechtbacteria bacterium]
MIFRRDPLRNCNIPLQSKNIIEPEEIFVDSSKIKEFEAEEIEVGKLEKEISSGILLFFRILQFALVLSVASFTAFLMLEKGGKYTKDANDNTLRAYPIFGERGNVYSSDAKVLAKNEVYFDVLIKNPKILKYRMTDGKLQELSGHMARALGRDSQELYQKFLSASSSNFFEFTLLKGVRVDQIARIEDLINADSLFEVRQVSRRRYIADTSFSSILGYTGEANFLDVSNNYPRGGRVGKSGIEAFYDEVLRGTTGFFFKKINSKGDLISEGEIQEPKKGQDLTLHIGAALETNIEKILKKHMEALGIPAAVAIVADPRNGAVLSLVSLPSFDGNQFEDGISETEFAKLVRDRKTPLFNRAIRGEYPSGSIVKPLIASGALEEKLVTPDFLVYGGGSIEVPSAYDPAITYVFKDWKVHGWTDIRKAIADSVNIYFYTIGGGYKDQPGLGIANIEKYLRDFGWGETLGVDLPGEASGRIPNPKWKKEVKGENWFIGDTYLTSIGQGDILVTPLQVAAATGALANGGTLFVPHIVQKIGDLIIPAQIKSSNFISKKNMEIVREGMRRAVLAGSSRFLSDLPFSVAGKTGTAEISHGRNEAWFSGFAPYEDPKVVVTVLLEEGEKSDYAVRAAKDIFQTYFELYPQS